MRIVTCIMVACLVLTAGPVSAEWFADVYVGQSFTEKNDVTVHSSAGLGIFRDASSIGRWPTAGAPAATSTARRFSANIQK